MMMDSFRSLNSNINELNGGVQEVTSKTKRFGNSLISSFHIKFKSRLSSKDGFYYLHKVSF